MEKVKVTQKQAEVIEEIKEHLKGFKYTEIFDALRYGYEVEPEYKVGDWVVYVHDNSVWEIKKDVYGNRNVFNLKSGSDFINVVDETHLRPATPSEIAEEKERRFWAKNGRGVWELKVNDVLSFKESNTTYNVEKVGHKMITASGGSRCVNYRLDQVKKLFKVACFAGDRLDV